MNSKAEMAELMAQGHSIVRIENETQQSIAVLKPRSEQKVIDNILAEMAKSPKIARKFFYSIEYEDGKKTVVEGISIQGSMAIQRRWQNSASNCRVIEDRPAEVICEGVFMDYENNNRVMRQVSVSKFYRPKGKNELVPEKRMDVKIAAGMSKAVRNAVLNGVPEYVKMAVLDQAKHLAKCEVQQDGTLKVRPLPERAAELIADYAEEGVSHERLQKKLGKNGMNEKDYDHLLGLLNAIQEGYVKVDEVFPDEKPAEPAKEKKPEVKLDDVLDQSIK